MVTLPEAVLEAWDSRKGPAVFATVDADGTPNSIWVGCISKFDDETVVVADNYFDKTRTNIKAGSKGSLLFITQEGKSFQIKGDIEYHTEGEIFEKMRECTAERLPRVAAAALKVASVYSGAEKLA